MIQSIRVQGWAGLFAVCLLIGLVLLGMGRGYIHRMVSAPLVPMGSEFGVLQVRSGMHFQSLIRELQWLGMARPSLFWRAYGRLYQPSIQAGEYRIEPGESMDDLLAKLSVGEVVLHPFTIVEGWTLADLRMALAADPKLMPMTGDWSEHDLMMELGCAQCPAEGRFLPETYLFERGEYDLEVLRRSYDAMDMALSKAWSGRDDNLPLKDTNELLILASLIERETAVPSERGTIAGVFVRRLNLGMRLQTDPTVIYGLGPTYNGRLTRQDLRTDHPWNTYTRHGLPATPIALPSLASLDAASRPEEGDVLYFVARGDGSHKFSKTLEEHNAAVNRYIRGRRP